MDMANSTSKLLAIVAPLIILACFSSTLSAQAAGSAEISLWESVRDSGSSAELQLFLHTYPNSRFAPLAKLRLRRLPSDEQGSAATTVKSQLKAGIVPPIPQHKQIGYAGFQIRIASADLDTLASPSYRPKIMVLKVFPFGEAAKAGFLVGDTIISINDHRPSSIADTVEKIRAVPAGKTIKFEIERDGQKLDIAMATGDKFALFWEAAHEGDGLAMSFLADEYLRGETVEENKAAAAQWMNKAGTINEPYVLFSKGFYTENNRFEERPPAEARSKALEYYLRSAELGEIDAIIAASRLQAESDEKRALSLARQAYSLDSGTGAKVLFDRMEEQKIASYQGISRDHLLRVAAESGNTEALRRIGLDAGIAGISEQQALQLIRRAAVWGNTQAQMDLGRRYENGQGTGRDLEAALVWYRKVAMNGFGKVRGEARSKIGYAYYHGKGTAKDLAKAYQWFEAASADNDSFGHFYVAYLSGRGEGTAENQEKAVEYFLKAAEMGDSDAMVNLGRRYQEGRGTSKSGKKAALWFKRAVEAGDLDGHCGLGDLHYYGGGGYRQSYKKAAETYRTAADKGNATCQFDLGFLYEHGLGVRKSRAEAIRLYRLAADNEERAVDRLKELGVAIFNPEAIQQLLSDLGYDPGPVDGKPGKRTRAAIRAFQQSENVTVDGQPGAALLDRLREVSRRMKSGDPPQVDNGDGLDWQDDRALSALENAADL
jgi:TPR repeat protein